MNACVLIPTYNESKAIAGIVTAARGMNLDVVVVDDGSMDDTGLIARQNGATVIMHNKNRGKGASLKAGFAHALANDYDAIIVMDGDGQHRPEDISRFISSAEETGADLVLGNRMNNTGTMPLVRQLTNKVMSGFISKFAGQMIPDTQCGFRLIRSNVLKNIKLTTSKYETESEILIKAGRNNFKIHSIPIMSIYNNEVSAIHPLKDSLRFIRLMMSIIFDGKPRR